MNENLLLPSSPAFSITMFLDFGHSNRWVVERLLSADCWPYWFYLIHTSLAVLNFGSSMAPKHPSIFVHQSFTVLVTKFRLIIAFIVFSKIWKWYCLKTRQISRDKLLLADCIFYRISGQFRASIMYLLSLGSFVIFLSPLSDWTVHRSSLFNHHHSFLSSSRQNLITLYS